LTAACCPKRDFYTPSPPLKNSNRLKQRVFCTAYSKKQAQKRWQKGGKKGSKKGGKKGGKKGWKKVYS